MSVPYNGGPAFPRPASVSPRVADIKQQDGMTLRDYFAAKAMQQLMPMVSNDPRTLMPLDFDVANMAYQMADAMLKARES
jgi:hypothetical protein